MGNQNLLDFASLEDSRSQSFYILFWFIYIKTRISEDFKNVKYLTFYVRAISFLFTFMEINIEQILVLSVNSLVYSSNQWTKKRLYCRAAHHFFAFGQILVKILCSVFFQPFNFPEYCGHMVESYEQVAHKGK
jgi:hypothetical protein